MKSFKKALCFLLIFALIFAFIRPTGAAAAKYYKMTVHYIDVGESDSILIQSEGKSMLIDAGNNGDGDNIVAYLKGQGVKKLDYVVISHPHADHLGGMDNVIEAFPIGTVIMTDVTHTTRTFEEVVDAIIQKKAKTVRPAPGDEYKIGKAKFTILSPAKKDYGDNLNNYSIALRLVNGKTSFLFIGDCETEAISDILDSKINIDSDAFLCGHHGSDTSTTRELISAVSPSSAVISVGKNAYGHPSDSTLKLLSENKIKTYRTDENGTIVATSTGKIITFDAKETKIKESTTISNDTVYLTKTGTKYHREECSMLKNSKIKTTVKKAKKDGYEPCSKCNPPE